jgi:tRNA (guanosine-2'-O-)-methyltransferase
MFRPPTKLWISDLNQTVPAQIVRDILFAYLTSERQLKISKVASQRCYSCFPVLEGIYDRGNVSAVLRSTEAMGFGQCYVIESSERFKESQRTTAGADKWIELRKFKTTKEAIDQLKKDKVQIVSTALSSTSIPIFEVDFTKPTALVLGNEKSGVSSEMLEASDYHVIIPMQGFVQSFNISVAASLCLWTIFQQRLNKLGSNCDVTSEEVISLEANYALRTLDSAPDILRRHLYAKK